MTTCWKCSHSSIRATSAGRRHESGCGTHASAASPNLVVDWVKVKTVGWPQSWSDGSLVFHELTDALSHVLCGLDAGVPDCSM